MKRCSACLLPAAVPGSDIDASGHCAMCRTPVPAAAAAPDVACHEDLERTLAAARGNPHAAHDCIVPLSGGKDSLYLLHRLKVDYGLRVLAFTSDIDLPTVAWASIRRAVQQLDVDHVIHAPAPGLMTRLFRHLLTHQEERGAVYTVSYVYAPMFEGAAIRLAAERRIPLVLAGYSPGQPDPVRMRYEFSPRLIADENWTPPHLAACGAFSADDLAVFHDPRRLPPGLHLPRYLAPFHAWPYDQERIMRAVAELGLVRRRSHASPIVSNYPINWLMMYSDLRNLGYNPYAPEFCELIRSGRASRRHWRVMAPLVDVMIRRRLGPGRAVAHAMRRLELRDEDLRITLPRGAYDPPMLRGA